MKISYTSKLFRKFLIWRIRHVSNKQFIYALSIIVGLAAGLGAVTLKNTTHLIRNFFTQDFSFWNFKYEYVILPTLGILLVIWIIKYFIKKEVGHGIPYVLHALSRKNGEIEPHNMYSSIIGSSITVGFGGSVGLEGPVIATGSAVGSNIGRFFHLHYKDIILLIGCACAGAVAAIFKAPIAGIVFALEVIMLDLTMSRLIPLLLSAVAGAFTSYFIFGQEVIYKFEFTDNFSLSQFPYYLAFGILAGLLSVYFTKIYLGIAKQFKKVKNTYSRLLIGGLILGLLIFIFPSLYGEGYEIINFALQGDFTYLFENSIFIGFEDSFWITIGIFVGVLLMKVVATSATFGAGGVGGIFAPSLFLGANAGLFFAYFANHFNSNLPASSFALVGMAGLISGVIHAPLTAIFLIAEITGGYELFFPLMLVSTVSYATMKIFIPNSVYTIQLAQRGELMSHDKDKTILRMMQIEKLIEKNFISVSIEGTLHDLIHAISKSPRNVFPVVDKDNNFYGLILLDNVRDIIFKPELYDTTYIRDLLYMPPYVVDKTESMEAIAQKFQLSGKFVLTVLEDGKYVGFVSRATVFSKYRRLIKHFSEE